MKPSRRELAEALEILLTWATGSNRDGNPHCHPEVRYALRILACERGISLSDIELRHPPIPE